MLVGCCSHVIPPLPGWLLPPSIRPFRRAAAAWCGVKPGLRSPRPPSRATSGCSVQTPTGTGRTVRALAGRAWVPTSCWCSDPAFLPLCLPGPAASSLLLRGPAAAASCMPSPLLSSLPYASALARSPAQPRLAGWRLNLGPQRFRRGSSSKEPVSCGHVGRQGLESRESPCQWAPLSPRGLVCSGSSLWARLPSALPGEGLPAPLPPLRPAHSPSRPSHPWVLSGPLFPLFTEEVSACLRGLRFRLCGWFLGWFSPAGSAWRLKTT